MLRHGPDDATRVTPEILFTIHEMTSRERKEDRIAAAHLEDFAPIGVLRPGDDLASLPFPAEDARAVIGRDQDFILAVLDLVDWLVLEKEGAFHYAMRGGKE